MLIGHPRDPPIHPAQEYRSVHKELRRYFLNTRDQNQDPSEGEWIIRMDDYGRFDHVLLSIDKFHYRHAVYPINEHNFNFSISEDGGAAIPLTLTEGNYTGVSFATHMQSVLNAGGGHTYAVTHDSAAQKLNIVVTGGAAKFLSVPKNIYEEIGAVVTPFSDFTNYTSEFPIDLAGTDYIEMVINISTKNFSSAAETNTFVRIPIEGEFNDKLTWTPTHLSPIWANTGGDLEFRYQLRDSKGNPYTLPPNAHIALELSIHAVSNFKPSTNDVNHFRTRS